MEKRYSAIIVGAGPAGCSAAITLARMGYEVLLLDRARFPRDKTCGDGLGAGTLALLDRLGIMPALEARRPWRIDGIFLSAPDGREVLAPIPSVPGCRSFGYVLPRKELDLILWEQVKQYHNVESIEGCQVTGLIRKGKTIQGVEARIGRETIHFHGSFVIAADGCHSVIARGLGLHNREKRHHSFAVRAYFEGVEEISSAIEIHYEEAVLPGYTWIFPTGEHSANVGAGIMNRFADQKGIKKLFDLFLSKNRFARRKLKGAAMVEGSLKGWPLPTGSFPAKRGRGNVLLAGDAGSFIDPMSGEGIYYALKSGELAASAVHGGLAEKTRGKTAADIYEQLWRQKFLWQDFRPAYLLQHLLTQKTVINYAIRRAKASPANAKTLAGAISHIYPKGRLLWNL